jgi:hypothetical protein
LQRVAIVRGAFLLLLKSARLQVEIIKKKYPFSPIQDTNFLCPGMLQVWTQSAQEASSSFPRQKRRRTRKRAEATKPAFNKKMQVVLEEGCGASCGTGLRGKSGEYIFTTSFITIGFDPFDDVCFSSKLTSSTVCTVFPRGNSLVVWNDGDVFDGIKVNGVILKNSEEI